MKNFKFVYLVLFLLFSSVGYADNETSNDSCNHAETITMTDFNGEIGQFRLPMSRDHHDYYRFRAPTWGDLTISYQSTSSSRLYIGRDNCSHFTPYPLNATYQRQVTRHFNRNQWVYLHIRDNSLRTPYWFNFSFKSDGDLQIRERIAPAPDPATVGQNVTFQLRAQNRRRPMPKNIVVDISYNQDVEIQHVVVSDTDLRHCSPTSGTLAAGSLITCTKSSDWGSTTNHKNLRLVVQPSTSGTLIQTATIRSTRVNEDFDSSNDSVTSSVVVNPHVDAADDTYTTYSDTALSDNVKTNDTPATGTTIALLTSPTRGVLNSFNNDGSFTYTPDINYPGTYTFTYRLTHTASGSFDDATVTILVTAHADAVDDNITTNINTPVTGNLATNDIFPPGATIAATSTPAHAASFSVGNMGSFSYTPTTGWTGTDSFTYTITDALGGTDTATVTIVVASFIDAVDDNYSTYSDENLTGNVLNNDTHGTAIQVVSHTNPSEGNLTLNSDGSFAYIPDINSTGAFTFTYTIRDASNQEDTATVTINIRLALFRDPNPQDFEIVYTNNTYGDIKLIGNSNICKHNTSGQCVNPGNVPNNDIKAQYKDGDANPGTVNSSSAKLIIPSASEVLWAGLYWQGAFDKDCQTGKKHNDPCNEPITDAIMLRGQTVKLGYSPDNADPKNIGYHTVTAEKYNWVNMQSDRWHYQGFSDVTNFVKSKGAGWYWGADLNLQVGHYISGGSLGAWALAVAYKDSNDSMKNLTIYHGFKKLAGHSDTTFTLSGFKTPKEGNVSSTLIFFAGEGDIKLKRDGISITNKKGVAKSLFNAANPVNNVLNSSISVGGQHVGADALYPRYGHNTIGIDIDTFDVGTSGQNIIGKDQNSTTVKMYTKGDGYFPGAFGLSTELYVPKLCYGYSISVGDKIKVPHIGDEKDRKFKTRKWGSNDPLQMRILIQNTEPSDFDYTQAKLRLTFSPDKFIYTAGQSKISPEGYNAYMDATETDTSLGQISIGSLGTNSPNGGTIGPLETVYSKLHYAFDTNYFSGHFDIHVDANMSFDPSMSPVHYEFSTAGSAKNQIGMCPSNPVYDPVWGMFNVENDSNDSKMKKRLPLYTQIAKRPYKVNVASYTKNATSGKYDTLTPSNATVEIELINAGSYDNNASTGYDITCREPTAQTGGDFISFKGANAVEIDPATLTQYDNTVAMPNAAFRLWVLTKKDPNATGSKKRLLVTHGCTAASDSGCFDTLYANTYGNAEDNQTKYCESACTSSASNGCYECLRTYFAYPYCSRDNFSIRPEGFRVRLYDANETNGSVAPIELINNQSTANISLAAGYKYKLRLEARTFTNSDTAKLYYKEFIKVANNLINPTTPSYLNSDMALLDFNDASSCFDQNNTSYSLTVDNNTTLETNSTFSHDNAGHYEFWMSDTNWTKVDQGTYRYKTVFDNDCRHGGGNPSLDKCSDCKLGDVSAPATGEVGCTVSSTGVKNYVKLPLLFQPYSFDLSDIDIGTNPPNQRYLFMTDLDDPYYNNTASLSNPMAAFYEGNITSLAKNGTVTSNFTDGCAASKLILRLSRETNASEATLKSLYGIEMQQYLQYGSDVDIQTTFDDTQLGEDANLTLAKAAFEDTVTPGSARVRIYTTFKKPAKDDIQSGAEGIEPIRVNYRDINATGYEANASADMSIHTPMGTQPHDQNITFIYSKVSPDEKLYTTDKESIATPLNIIVYCSYGSALCQNFDLNTSSSLTHESSNWYLASNLFGTASDLGTSDLNVSYYSGKRAGNAHLELNATTTRVKVLKGVGYELDGRQDNIIVSLPTDNPRPVTVEVKYHSVPWLNYKTALEFYRVRFIPKPTSWTGYGKTGHVVEDDISTTKTKRLEW